MLREGNPADVDAEQTGQEREREEDRRDQRERVEAPKSNDPVAQIVRQARRLVVLVIGGTVVLAGIAMLALPGPGWAAIFLGLAILSAEFVWARVVLKRAKRMAAEGIGGVRALVFGRQAPGGK